ncbi:TIM barrel protein [Flavobacteriaceae bacterium]|jgi:hydroxypyruvate isomerase|nr:TIM barrel protein [Flavobacteriaceae bacterium]
MKNENKIQRRDLIKTLAVGATTAFIGSGFTKLEAQEVSNQLKGNINHSVCQWCYPDLSLDELCEVAKEFGLMGIDLIGPSGWDTLKKHDLVSTMCNGAEISLTEGFNDPQYHSELIENYTKHIKLVAEAGFTNLICFSGNKRGMDDETGLQNCVKGLQQILPLAEKLGVVIQMELFNSKVNHPDYMCDNSAWGIELCKRLDSPNFKLLYDIYHMQISEGDIIRTITDNHQYFGHYHTAGVPGRNEIDDTQELFYPAIMSAIVESGYKGVVAQEFIPKNENPLESLKNSILICDV